MKSNHNSPKELDDVCLAVGSFIEYWGFKSIEGRLWCHILLSSRPLCAQDLILRTGVTKGLVSISLARLLEYEVIRIEFIQGKRTQFYQVNEDVTSVIKGVLRNRERKILSDVLSTIGLLKSLSRDELVGISSKRLQFLTKMVEISQSLLDTFLFKDKKISTFFFGNAPKIKVEKVESSSE